MSRIGKLPIALPQGVTCSFSAHDGLVTVKGPKGELKQVMHKSFSLKTEGNSLQVIPPTQEKKDKAKHGLYRALIANMVVGVSQGYRKEMELVGVGYKAAAQGNVLDLSLGYSHSLIVGIPPELKVQAIQEKGQNPLIILEGIDKQLIGQVAAKIKSLRSVEPYKGKGIRFVGEYVRKKAGKSASAK